MKKTFTHSLQSLAAGCLMLLIHTSIHSQTVLNVTGTYTRYVHTTGTYTITAVGAEGGDQQDNSNVGGTGATIVATFSLTAGDVLTVFVGDNGLDGAGNSTSPGGGGGGSAVILNSTNVLIAAGGGGGASRDIDSQGGQANTNSTPTAGASPYACGGGGAFDATAPPSSAGCTGVEGGKQGTLTTIGLSALGKAAGGSCNNINNHGGQGFGGGGGGNNTRGGGGGGYKGGDGATGAGTIAGGGDSFVNMAINSGAVVSATAGTTGSGGSDSDGSITINPAVFTTPLPVELISFHGFRIAGQTVRLDWRTASELNNDGFEVQRSIDGEEWGKLAFVPGHGTTTETHDYSFLDKKPLSGTNYYRLRQTDFDGGEEYSKVVSVKVGSPTNSLTFFPNPAPEGITSLYFPEAPEGEGLLEVFDWLGNKVHHQAVLLEGGSEVLVPVDLHSFPSGMYVATLEMGGKVFSEKLVLKR